MEAKQSVTAQGLDPCRQQKLPPIDDSNFQHALSWFKDNQGKLTENVILALKSRFGLKALECVQVIQIINEPRYQAISAEVRQCSLKRPTDQILMEDSVTIPFD